jgi:predicted phage terminase large subunit-like protein
VYLLDGAPWLEAFTNEVCGFPRASYDDRVDALTQCLNHHISEEPGGYELPDW